MESSSDIFINIFAAIGYIGAAIVIIGIAGESKEILEKLLKKRAFRKSAKRAFGRKPLFVFICFSKLGKQNHLRWQVFAILFVIGGLSIEWVGGGTAELMQTKENEELVATNMILLGEVDALIKQEQASRLKADTLESEIEYQRSKSIILETNLDESIKRRLEVEEALYPRTFEGGADLAKFKGVKFALTVFPVGTGAENNESAKFANSLVGALIREGWNLTNTYLGAAEPVGVTIITSLGAGSPPFGKETSESFKAASAGSALVELLRNENIMTRYVGVNDRHGSQEYVEIFIGRKPTIEEIRSHPNLNESFP